MVKPWINIKNGLYVHWHRNYRKVVLRRDAKKCTQIVHIPGWPFKSSACQLPSSRALRSLDILKRLWLWLLSKIPWQNHSSVISLSIIKPGPGWFTAVNSCMSSLHRTRSPSSPPGGERDKTSRSLAPESVILQSWVSWQSAAGLHCGRYLQKFCGNRSFRDKKSTDQLRRVAQGSFRVSLQIAFCRSSQLDRIGEPRRCLFLRS